jgi:predicted ATPase
MLRLKSLTIKNYKSLRNVTFEPGNFSVLVGPNGAGKSNLADALDFLANVYRDGLEMAIQRKGGYENILYRKQRRTKSALEFEVVVEGVATDFLHIHSYWEHPVPAGFPNDVLYQVTHYFSVGAKSENIDSDFSILKEELALQIAQTQVTAFRIKRHTSSLSSSLIKATDPLSETMLRSVQSISENELNKQINDKLQSLFIHNIYLNGATRVLNLRLGSSRIYSVSPLMARQPGTPTPNVEITQHGDNLPALVDWLQKNVPEKWEQLIEAMQTILPSLDDIKVEYIYNQKLGLFFSENSQGRPWNMEIVSDGTLLSLATLCAAADPRQSITVIEEPENSLHPWALRTLIRQFRKFSQDKQIILTTHSPTLIDMLRPEEIWCVAKDDKGTHIDPLVALDQDIVSGWEDGKFKLSTYLDAGLIPNAIPGGL